MSSISILPISIEKAIAKRINELFNEHSLTESFPNPLIRDDVLDILDRFCTVVYYPLENEKNNGFHVNEIPFADGTKNNFVFINTAQTMEKQVFTAAHELGHIWKIDDYIIADQGLVDTCDMRELIINRFAAVLLIPERLFRGYVKSIVKELTDDSKSLSTTQLLKLVVMLMNQFYVPMKAIVLRLVELNYIPVTIAEFLLGNQNIPEAVIEQYMQSLIADYGFVKFQKPSMKKWIEGLSEKLDIAEKQHLLPQKKIDYMRRKFDLKPPSLIDSTIETVVSLDTQEGFDTDDGQCTIRDC